MAISMLKIRRPLGRLIFNMGIAIPGKTVFLIETAPRAQWINCGVTDALLADYDLTLNMPNIFWEHKNMFVFLPKASFGLWVLSLPASVCPSVYQSLACLSPLHLC